MEIRLRVRFALTCLTPDNWLGTWGSTRTSGSRTWKKPCSFSVNVRSPRRFAMATAAAKSRVKYVSEIQSRYDTSVKGGQSRIGRIIWFSPSKKAVDVNRYGKQKKKPLKFRVIPEISGVGCYRPVVQSFFPIIKI